MSFTEAELHRLLHLNYRESSREMTRWSGRQGSLEERDGLLFVACGSTFPVEFNAVIRTDPTVPGAEVIAAADAWFGAKGRGWCLNVRPGVAEDDDLAAAAEGAGLLALGAHPEMVCRSRLEDRPAADGVELRWVSDEAGMLDAVTINDAAYVTLGMPAGNAVAAVTCAPAFTEPHVRTLVAYLDDQPVATAMTVLSHGIGGVYWVGTDAEARGRGLAESVTRAVTNRAFDEGARAVGLQASSMGEPIYARMGYEPVYDYVTHIRFEPLA